jgi:predicted transcriptional regulator
VSIHVTEAESAVLDALWRCGPLPPARLIAEVKATRRWGDATIKTLLGRLMQKKAIVSQREDGRLLYYPLLSREAHVGREVQGLIDRLFEGDPSNLAAYLASARTSGT